MTNTKETYPFLAELITSYDVESRIDDDTWVFYDAVIDDVLHAVVEVNFATGKVDCYNNTIETPILTIQLTLQR